MIIIFENLQNTICKVIFSSILFNIWSITYDHDQYELLFIIWLCMTIYIYIHA